MDNKYIFLYKDCNNFIKIKNTESGKAYAKELVSKGWIIIKKTGDSSQNG